VKYIVTLLVIVSLAGSAEGRDVWSGIFNQQLMAARRGDADAQYSLAGMYKNGQGVAADRDQAIAWYRKAAAQKHARAKSALSLMQANQRRFEQALSSAVEGNVDSQYKLANMYAMGTGTDSDPELARKWYQSAAQHGHDKAQYKLARFLYSDVGKASDEPAAFAWFRRSAEQGYAPAQYYVAEMYALGRGVEKDLEQALLWYQKAAEGGYGPAYKGIRQIEILGASEQHRLATAREQALAEVIRKAEEEHSRLLATLRETAPGHEPRSAE
jgi:TPR repeat protein